MSISERQKIKKIAVMTSGGDAPGLNACIRVVVRTAIYNQLQVVGIQHGFDLDVGALRVVAPSIPIRGFTSWAVLACSLAR